MATVVDRERAEMMAIRRALVEVLSVIERANPGVLAMFGDDIVKGVVHVNPTTPPAGERPLSADDKLIRAHLMALLADSRLQK